MKKSEETNRPYEIVRVRGNTGYIKCPILIPFYRVDSTHCILMDTGTEMMRARLIKTLKQNDLIPIGILCTHSHYDHFGNTRYLAETYHCPVALPIGEAEICRTLTAVKSHLFCFSEGQVANDPKMSAIPCVIDHVIRPEENDTIFCGVRFRVIHTPGHAIDHASYITPDNVCYIGDALMCGHSLTASKLPYAYHMKKSMESMEQLRDLSCSHIILAHRGVIEADDSRGKGHLFDEIIDQNLTVMRTQIEAVLKLMEQDMTVQDIYMKVEREFGITVDTPEKALNLERFFRPYLEYLIDTGDLKQSVREGCLCYGPNRP